MLNKITFDDSFIFFLKRNRNRLIKQSLCTFVGGLLEKNNKSVLNLCKLFECLQLHSMRYDNEDGNPKLITLQNYNKCLLGYSRV